MFLLGLLSCDNPTPVPTHQGCLAESDEWVAPNGRRFTVAEIDEFFCPCNANCVWTPDVIVTLRSDEDSLRLSYYDDESKPDWVTEEHLVHFPPDMPHTRGTKFSS